MFTPDSDPMIERHVAGKTPSQRHAGVAAKSLCAALLGLTASLAVTAAAGPSNVAAAVARHFDATTVDRFSKSYQAIVATLPAGEAPRLEVAVEQTLRSYALASGRALRDADLRRLFDGKTAEQVVASAPRPDSPALRHASVGAAVDPLARR